MSSTISVVLAAHNRERYLAQSIESILAQTYTDLELVVVDDESDDRTPEIIREFERRDRRVRGITIPHGGQCIARNAGVEAARFDWLAIMDSDDLAPPYRLEREMAMAQSDPEVVLWGGYVTRITAEGVVIDTLKFGPNSKEEFYRFDRAKTPFNFYNATSLCRRDLFLKVGGFDPKFRYHTDSDLCDRMADHGPILILPEPMVLYRQHGDSETAKMITVEEMYFQYISARYRARRQGRVLEIEDFIEAYGKRPFPQKAISTLRTVSLAWATRSLIAFARKQYVKGARLALAAAILNPVRAVSKLAAVISGR